MSIQTPISETTGRGKMSPQAAVGYSNWPDEDGRQSKHRYFRKHGTRKRKSLRSHRTGR